MVLAVFGVFGTPPCLIAILHSKALLDLAPQLRQLLLPLRRCRHQVGREFDALPSDPPQRHEAALAHPKRLVLLGKVLSAKSNRRRLRFVTKHYVKHSAASRTLGRRRAG